MLRLAAIAIFGILSLCAVFLSGAWLGDSARASLVALTVAFLLAVCALALAGCAPVTLYHACRDGLCR